MKMGTGSAIPYIHVTAQPLLVAVPVPFFITSDKDAPATPIVLD